MDAYSAETHSSDLREVRIFICSSGDMLEERAATIRVVGRLNESFAGLVRLVAYRWEDNLPEFDPARTYQANIPLPQDFDIFVGLLFSRVGTPLTANAYARDLGPPLQALHAQWLAEGSSAPDSKALDLLTGQLGPDRMPTGTRFEIENALAGASRAGHKPHIWLAVNEATPDLLYARDPAIADPVRNRWNEVNAFVKELEADHGVSITCRYGLTARGEPLSRKAQLEPAGMREFEHHFEHALRRLLRDHFAVSLTWDSDAYVGLQPFQANQARIFFGRQHHADEALKLMNTAVATGRLPMLLLTGPSGAGKSSFGRAGLIGSLGSFNLNLRLGAEGSDLRRIAVWRTLAERPANPGEDPVEKLLAQIGATLEANDTQSLAARVTAVPVVEPSARLPTDLARDLRDQVQSVLTAIGPDTGLFILLDQFEDLFGAPNPKATGKLLAVLRALAESPRGNIWICIALADQWRSELRGEGLESLLEGAETYPLPPLRGIELRQVITAPAARAGLVFGHAPDGRRLDEVIERDLKDLSLSAEAPLPLLQEALRQLEERRDGHTLTWAAYERMNRLKGAIEAHAAAALRFWETPEQLPVLTRVLFSLLQKDPQARVVSRLAPQAELQGDPEMWVCVKDLLSEQHRLLQGTGEGRHAGVRLLHDVLLEQSGFLRDFLQKERENIVLLDRMREVAQEWESKGRPADLLRRDRSGLKQLRPLLKRAGIPTDDPRWAFTDASMASIRRQDRDRLGIFIAFSAFIVVAAFFWQASRTEENLLGFKRTWHNATCNSPWIRWTGSPISRKGYGIKSVCRLRC